MPHLVSLTRNRTVQPPSRIGLTLDRNACLRSWRDAVVRAMWILIGGMCRQHSNQELSFAETPPTAECPTCNMLQEHFKRALKFWRDTGLGSSSNVLV